MSDDPFKTAEAEIKKWIEQIQALIKAFKEEQAKQQAKLAQEAKDALAAQRHEEMMQELRGIREGAAKLPDGPEKEALNNQIDAAEKQFGQEMESMGQDVDVSELNEVVGPDVESTFAPDVDTAALNEVAGPDVEGLFDGPGVEGAAEGLEQATEGLQEAVEGMQEAVQEGVEGISEAAESLGGGMSMGGMDLGGGGGMDLGGGGGMPGLGGGGGDGPMQAAGEKAGETIGAGVGEAGGKAIGGAIGSVVPGVGTAVGEEIGGQIGKQAGKEVGKQVGGAVGKAGDMAVEGAAKFKPGSVGDSLSKQGYPVQRAGGPKMGQQREQSVKIGGHRR
ncbi:MAG: hypothetical protein R3F13_14690 [Prosthecobacter sp.]